ncbi:MAG: insulinase family protein [Kiritimatiellae bacterium]|nr:insulinase family protein [Kiritimatiellia bacterium]MCO5068292.1 insulinase family protein [Kiritimatiellia bacterium]
MTQHGFEWLRTEEIAEYQAKAHLYRHIKTGAELLSIEVADENKVFGITFRTPPSDSTGVAHILEHSVLCGSKKYPTKEPFVELLKGSLQTFLNAFTYPDKTCYPVASQNLQDFYNLIDVYLDAVFYPILSRGTYEQEGWHYELESPDKPLIYKGVVFNEMKGVYSSPDSVLMEQAQRSLFPDTTYGLDSGGDPAHIPDLTYEQLTGFHKRFYHPSNSRIFFYGDDDLSKRLELLDAWLTAFDRQDPNSAIAVQAPFPAPREVNHGYRTDAEEGGKSFVALNWALPSPVDATASLHANILAHILIGTPASPLRNALLESGLGDDLTGCGLESHALHMFFSTGLRGVDAKNVSRVAPLVRDTLASLAQNGIDPRTVEASLNTLEFALRENNTGNYPRGLALMLRALSSWNYDGDPIAALRFAEAMTELRARIASGERVFEELIRRWFLDNTHHSIVTLSPDRELGARQDAAERARLDAARAAMNADQAQAVAQHTAELIAAQGAPDSPEALARIPRLTLADLPRANKAIPIQKLYSAGTRVLYHDIFTNGILYLDVGFNLRGLTLAQLPYVPLLGRALLETGTASEDYISLSQRIGSRTGGIEPQTLTSVVRETESGTCWLFLRGKAMESQTDDLLAILHDVLTGARLDLRARIKQIALEEKANIEANLVPSGHTFVGQRIRAGFDEANYAEELMNGVSYLQFLRELINEMDTNWDSVASALERIQNTLLNRRSMTINVAIDQAAWDRVAPRLHSFLADLPSRVTPLPAWTLPALPETEGLIIPAAVNYVGKAFNWRAAGHVFSGSDLVVSRFLRTAYLWEKVRVQGGAYGGFSQFDHRAGLVSFISYRDPNLKATLDIYDATADYLTALQLSPDELEKAIIGAIGDLDKYRLPSAQSFTSLNRFLANDTDAFLQRLREEILGTTLKDFHRFGEMLRGMSAQSRIAILGSNDALQAFQPPALTRIL